MRVSVFGLGYVGAVSAACLARNGNTVIGVDTSPEKVECIQSGRSPVIEPGMNELIVSAREDGRLRATSDAAAAVRETELSLICVGTPSLASGDLNTDYVKRVCEEIGAVLASKPERHVVVVRSTVLPGTIEQIVIPALEEASGKRVGTDFGVCANPEFLREGTAIADFDAPPKTVIGEGDPESANLVESLYEAVGPPVLRVPIPIAEMVKYCDNTWHALKISFANEIGNIAKSVGLDSHRLMEIFCLDTKLNISPAYLKPGQAFGGSCLPKDVRALRYFARSLDLETPIVNAILPSNQIQLERAIDLVLANDKKKVGVLGLAFKAGTDDVRESPIVELVERLIGKGYEPRIYDRNVSLATLVGANRGYLMEKIPHVSSLLMDSLDDVIAHGDTLVIGNASPDFRDIADRCRPDQTIIDLVRILAEPPDHGGYQGICW